MELLNPIFSIFIQLIVSRRLVGSKPLKLLFSTQQYKVVNKN